MVPSPSNRYYLVSTLFSANGGAGRDNGMSRLQVFESATGKLNWELQGIWALQAEISLSDDGEHLAILQYWQTGKPETLDQKVPVLSFYQRGKLLKKWSSEELKIPRSAFRASSSHSSFWAYNPSSPRWGITGEPPYNDDGRAAENPSLEGTNFSLRTYGRELLKFDIRTGELSSRTDLPPSEPLSDPFER